MTANLHRKKKQPSFQESKGQIKMEAVYLTSRNFPGRTFQLQINVHRLVFGRTTQSNLKIRKGVKVKIVTREEPKERFNGFNNVHLSKIVQSQCKLDIGNREQLRKTLLFTSLLLIRYRTSRPLRTAKVWLSKSGGLSPRTCHQSR